MPENSFVEPPLKKSCNGISSGVPSAAKETIALESPVSFVLPTIISKKSNPTVLKLPAACNTIKLQVHRSSFGEKAIPTVLNMECSNNLTVKKARYKLHFY